MRPLPPPRADRCAPIPRLEAFGRHLAAWKNFLHARERFLYTSLMPIERTQPFAPRISLALVICLTLAGLFVAGCDRPAPADSTSSSSPASGNETLVAGVIFSADPNPVPPGNPKGRTTISWDTGSDAVGEVYVVNAGTEKLFASGRQGSQDAPWIQAGPNEFRLYDQADHKLLARLTVTMIVPDSSGNKTSAAPSSSRTPNASASPR